jgi:LysR family transcriptional regulator, cys regulon transcriptional activator
MARRAYKEVRLQQLRSFCETARLGSLAGAAESLGVSQPTVWEQVHALEKEFDMPLIEPHGRGCRVTDVGRMLAEMADPLVAGIDSLKRALRDRLKGEEARLTVVAPARILVEDLPDVISTYMRKYPHVRLRLVERVTGQVMAVVESGEADLGVGSEREAGTNSPRLQLEPAYQLDSLLITPADHPLARRRKITPKDLKGYPLVNSPDGFSRPEVGDRLRQLGVFDAPRHLEAVTTAVIRHYVKMKLGIGLVLGRLTRHRDPKLAERSMSEHFGRAGMCLVWRKGVVPSEHARAFADTLKELLGDQEA